MLQNESNLKSLSLNLQKGLRWFWNKLATLKAADFDGKKGTTYVHSH